MLKMNKLMLNNEQVDVEHEQVDVEQCTLAYCYNKLLLQRRTE